MVGKKHICKTCKWAKWERGPRGGILKTRSGQCGYPRESIDLAIKEFCRKIPAATLSSVDVYLSGIWMTDAFECDVWESEEQFSRCPKCNAIVGIGAGHDGLCDRCE